MYQTTTLADALSAVAARLADPTFTRWTVTELTALVQEALRTWNALTGHFRDQGVFTTVSGQPFYDLAVTCPSQVGYTVTDRDIVGQIEAFLLEPVTPTSWTGSDQFTLNDVVSAIQNRRDQFLLETGLVLSRSTPTVIPSMGGRVPLDEAIIAIRRAAFTNSDGTTPLHREDVWAFNHWSLGWPQQPGRPPESPFGYSVGETQPLVLQIVPPLSDRGILDLVSVSRGTLLNPVTPVVLGIPDDWAWVVTFGALADLLSKDGLANDPMRASYCQQRWEQGIQVARTASMIWAGRVNNVPCQVATVTEADDFLSIWQSTMGTPDTVLTTMGSLVALSPVPDGVYGMTIDLVRNQPVPVLLTDYLQVGSEVLDPLYDYIEHLAYFKEGGPAVTASQPLLDRFFRSAGVEVAIDTAQTPNLKALTDQSSQDERHTARTVA